MVRPNAEFVKLAKDYVCVRVTDMRHIDLSRFQFDYDLTFAVLFMNADGTVYHRFGSRNSSNPLSWASLPALLRVMRETIADHEQYQKAPAPPKAKPKRTILDNPLFASRDKKKRVECVHCHMVHDFRRDWAKAKKKWRRDDVWLWPPPSRVGLTMDPKDQALVTAVAKDSAAFKAGLRTGHRLLFAADQRIRTIMDMQWSLENIPMKGGVLPIRFHADGKEVAAKLQLANGWRRGTPATFAWRPTKWGLDPRPGFGGPELNAKKKKKLGIAVKDFAFRVNYLVTWGPHHQTGRNAARAGIRKNDVIVAVDGKRDFESIHHFHAWIRLKRKAGDTLAIELLRRGKKHKVSLRLL